MHDLLILGNGPAALSLAARAAARGLSVACMAPAWPASLPNTYGVWLDDLPHDLCHLAACVWHHPHATFTPGQPIDLARTYARLDNARLAAHLTDLATSHGATLLTDHATRVTHTPTTSTVHTITGALHNARLIIDATGAATTLIERPGPSSPGHQIAYGVMIHGLDARIRDRLVAPMILMDYTPSGPDALPTFLYAMKVDDEHTFLEETTLVSRPALSLDTLRHRLDLRMQRALGVRLDDLAITEVERCQIPMGLPLPSLTQRTFAYGAAATMIHPASGYQLARALSWAPALADGLHDAIYRDQLTGDALSRRAWGLLWTPDRLRQHELYRYGMEMLVAMSGDQLRAFFSTFFALPQRSWSGFLSGELETLELMRIMLHIFGASSMSTRLDLIRPALRGALPHLLRGLRP
jgi:lycopene cyclase-like protein